jgi:hypothetical protein
MGTEADLDVDIYRDFPELYLFEFPVRPRHGGAIANGQKQAPGEPIATAFGAANYALLLRRKGSSRTSTGLSFNGAN